MSAHRFQTIAKLSLVATPAVLIAACLAPGPRVMDRTPPQEYDFPCADPRPYDTPVNCDYIDDEGNGGKKHQACVRFTKPTGFNYWCIDPAPDAHIAPVEGLRLCPGDDVTWEAVRDDGGNTTGQHRFSLWFIPLDTGRGGGRPPQETAWHFHRHIVELDAPDAYYKYTIKGGHPSCNRKIFDPRIKVDPK